MDRRTAFVTGATGFVGSFLTAFLLHQGYRVVALVRGPLPRQRLTEVLCEVDGERLGPTLAARLEVIGGDVRHAQLGLSEDAQRWLSTVVDEVWHCATSFKFHPCHRDEVIAHNVTGTKHLLDLTFRWQQSRPVSFFYVSTAYAAPLREGVAREELAPVGAPARNLYEWSKQEAERLVVAYHERYALPVTIFRPAIIVGHTHTGKAVRFTGYYEVLRAVALLVRNLEVNLGRQFDRNLHLRVRAQPETALNLVPIDFVVEAMWRVSRASREGIIFHLANETPVLVTDLFQYACEELEVTGIDLVGEESFRARPMTSFERLFERRTRFQAPYLLDGPWFDTTQFRACVPAQVLPCPTIDAAFMRRVNRYYLAILDRQFEAIPLTSVSSIVPSATRPGQVSLALPPGGGLAS
ncbi:MAG: SDR family oxidoreductase [Candidatus Binatia bacterium]|nr:SDR family oxidoreductase [Candidatus Binatia bacterium]